MKPIVISVAAAALVLASGCASTGQQLAFDAAGCPLNTLAPASSQHASGPWASNRIVPGDPHSQTQANCASNRALEQMALTRRDQQRNTAVSFQSETQN